MTAAPTRTTTTDTSIVPPLPDYPERIVTYIDLLGFSRDVQMIEERPGLLLSIDAVLSAIVRCKRDLRGANAVNSITIPG